MRMVTLERDGKTEIISESGPEVINGHIHIVRYKYFDDMTGCLMHRFSEDSIDGQHYFENYIFRGLEKTVTYNLDDCYELHFYFKEREINISVGVGVLKTGDIKYFTYDDAPPRGYMIVLTKKKRQSVRRWLKTYAKAGKNILRGRYHE